MWKPAQTLTLVALTAPILVLALTAATLNADTIYVCWDGSGDYLTIQEGIDAAQDSDEVIVCDGTYTGAGNKDLDFHGKAITVRSANGPENCTIDCEADGRGFDFYSGETPDAMVAGLTITNGGPISLPGAAIRCRYGSSPTLVNCTLTGNSGYMGGGLYCWDASSPTLVDCTIAGNSADMGGGAVYCRNNSGPTLINCTIAGNSGYQGGGLYCRDASSPTLAGCTITANSADNEGGGLWCYGSSFPVLTNCTVTANTATSWGGGVECNNAGVTLVNSTIQGNTAYGGGALSCYRSTASLSNSLMTDNSGDVLGGGVLCKHGSSLTLANCTMTGNRAPNGQELACYSDGQNDPSAVVIRGCILYSTVWGWLWNHDGSTIAITYSDLWGGWSGEGNIDADPLFVDPDGPDDDPNTWEDNDHHLGADSPCIDTGDPNFVPEPDERDIDGQMRVWDGDDDGQWIVDMGSDEFGSIIPGDLDGDACVGHGDLGILLGDWGCTTGDCPGDCDFDGDTDHSDLGLLLGHWGEGCP